MEFAAGRMRLYVVCALAAMLMSAATRAQAPTPLIVPINASRFDSNDAVRRAVASAAADGVDAFALRVSLYWHVEGGFDGVAALIAAAHDRGLRVRATIDSNIVTAVDELPASRDHLFYDHPEWLMIPRALAPEMLRITPRSPGYVGRLARWTRANAARVEGVYLSPLAPGVSDYATRAVAAMLRRYAFDSVEIVAAPYPDDEFDYSRGAMDVFRADVRARLDAAERTRMDEFEALDPFAYPDEFPDQWRLFQRSRLDGLIGRISASARAARPSVLLAAGDAAANPAP